MMHAAKTRKNKFTRMCIAEAIIDLLKNTEYSKLRISTIIKRAGVARMTFYKYYLSPYDALTDYLSIIIEEYLETCHTHRRHAYMQYEHILDAFYFFDQYADFFLVLYEKNLYSIMIDGMNSFIDKHVKTNSSLTVYDRYFYSGGLLNTFIQWELHEKQTSAEELAKRISQFTAFTGQL